MPYLLRVYLIRIIAGMIQFIPLHFILKLPFQFGVVLFRSPHVCFLGGIRSHGQGGDPCLKQRSAGGQSLNGEYQQKAQRQERREMLLFADVFHGLFCCG